MKRTREQIFEEIQRNLDSVRGFGVKRLSLFGSAVRNESSDTSDLDFVVEFTRKTFDAYMDLKGYLEGLFGCHVDLVIADAIKPRLRPIILKEAVHVPGL